VIQDAEIKAAFFWFDLLPCDRHQDGVYVHDGELGDDQIGLCRSSRRRIAEFPTENQKGLAVYDELSCYVLHFDVRQFGGM
jgi:hypothetical protein